MSIKDNHFIQSILNDELPEPERSYHRLDKEIIPLLKFFWENNIETHNSCASHNGIVEENQFECYYPYVTITKIEDSSFFKLLNDMISKLNYTIKVTDDILDDREIETIRLEFIPINKSNDIIKQNYKFLKEVISGNKT